jgi:hypothetical protein
MILWTIRNKKTGLFFNGGKDKDGFSETPINKLYRIESHARAALTQLLRAESNNNKYHRRSRGIPESWEYRDNLEIVKLSVEVVEDAELV